MIMKMVVGQLTPSSRLPNAASLFILFPPKSASFSRSLLDDFAYDIVATPGDAVCNSYVNLNPDGCYLLRGLRLVKAPTSRCSPIGCGRGRKADFRACHSPLRAPPVRRARRCPEWKMYC